MPLAFGEWLKEARAKKGWTAKETAERLKIERAWLSQIEAGDTPSEELCAKIIDLFDGDGDREQLVFAARRIAEQLDAWFRQFPNAMMAYLEEQRKRPWNMTRAEQIARKKQGRGTAFFGTRPHMRTDV